MAREGRQQGLRSAMGFPWQALVWLGGFALLILHELYFSSFLIDDVFIPFRYAQNLAQGNGLVFNPGEPVEGYSNFLWVILLSLFSKAGLELVTAAKVLGILFSLSTAILLAHLSWRLGRGRGLVPGLSVLLLASSGPFTLWSTSGLETPLFAFLLTAAAYRYLVEDQNQRYWPISSLLFALLAMTRPEGAVFFGVSLVHRASRWLKRRSFRSRDALWLMGFLLVFGVYFIWRLSYYGYPLPNSVYLKAGGGYLYNGARGLYYLYRFLTEGGGLPLLFILLPLAFLGRRAAPWVTYFLALVGIYTLFIVGSGGDWMPMFRFFAPILPLVLLLGEEGLRQIYQGVRQVASSPFWRAATMAFIVTGLAASFLGRSIEITELDRTPQRITKATEWGRQTALLLGAYARPGDTVAAVDAGALGYYSGLPVIDMVGLLDVHIAHLPPRFPMGLARGNGFGKWDVDYILRRKPTYIQMHVVALSPTGGPTDWVGTDALFLDPEFQRQYEPLEEPGLGHLFRRKD